MKGLIPKKPDTSPKSSSSQPKPVAKVPKKKKHRRNRTGKGHKEKRQQMARLVFQRKIRKKRKESLSTRGACLSAGKESVGPKISVLKSVMLDGAPRDLTNGATHYHTRAVQPSWARRFPQTAAIGSHLFYRQSTQTASN